MQNDIVRRPVVRPKTRKPEGAVSGQQDNQQEPIPAQVEDVVREDENISVPAKPEPSSPDSAEYQTGPTEPANDQNQEPLQAEPQQVNHIEEPDKAGHWGVISAAILIFIILAGLAVYTNLKPETQENNAPQPAALNQPEPDAINNPDLNNPTTEPPSGLNVQP